MELLPAPLGPMMARISCSRTSKLIEVSAFTPPNESEMPFSSSSTSPMERTPLMPLRGTPGDARGERLDVDDAQVCGHHTATAVLEFHQRLDVLRRLAVVQRVDKRLILLGHEAAPQLARPRQLVVVGVELLVQDEEAVDL